MALIIRMGSGLHYTYNYNKETPQKKQKQKAKTIKAPTLTPADRGFLDVFVVITSLWEIVTDIYLAVQEDSRV